MQKEIEMKSFNENLYWSLAELFPEMTVRSLSRMMGKSEGYWSSLNAQHMPVSTAALAQLLETLEFRKTRLAPSSQAVHRVDKVQELIALELIERFRHKTGLEYGIASSAGSVNAGIKATQPKELLPMPFCVVSY